VKDQIQAIEPTWLDLILALDFSRIVLMSTQCLKGEDRGAFFKETLRKSEEKLEKEKRRN
jgi:hypothetical protein